MLGEEVLQEPSDGGSGMSTYHTCNLAYVLGGNNQGWERENVLEIPRTQRPRDPPLLQVIHQLDEPGLRLLMLHGAALDGADLLGRDGALLCCGEALDVV